jgi:hypothetical protein
MVYRYERYGDEYQIPGSPETEEKLATAGTLASRYASISMDANNSREPTKERTPTTAGTPGTALSHIRWKQQYSCGVVI